MSRLSLSIRYIKFVLIFSSSACCLCSLSAQADGYLKKTEKLKFTREQNSLTVDKDGKPTIIPMKGDGLARLATPVPNSTNALPSEYCNNNPDCGVHALYYLLKLRGKECTQEEVAARLPVDEGTGTSMLGIRDASSGFGCSTVVVHLSASDAVNHVPFIAKLKGNKKDSNDDSDGHYVVVTSITDIKVKMIDSSGSGYITAKREAFERDFSGYALIVRKPWWNAAWIKISLLSICSAEVLLILTYFLTKKIHSESRISNASSNAQRV